MMERKRIIVAACMILAAVLVIALTWNTGRASKGGKPGPPNANQAQVVTEGGTVTLVPKGNANFTVVATFPATNSQSKTSLPAAVPKGK